MLGVGEVAGLIDQYNAVMAKWSDPDAESQRLYKEEFRRSLRTLLELPIDLLIASHVVEHINPARGNFLNWMAEAWRVLKPGGQFLISYPYAGSPGFWQDPTHCNGCTERTWTYFDPHHENRLFLVYRPKPFHIVSNEFQMNGNAEVRLAKLAVKPEFGCLETQPYQKKAK